MATGVYTAYKKDGTEYYRVSLTCQNKHISLGSFDDYKTAAAVYSEANAIVRDEKSSHFVNAAEKIDVYKRQVICCSLPVPKSLADTFTIPLASISNVTSI